LLSLPKQIIKLATMLLKLFFCFLGHFTYPTNLVGGHVTRVSIRGACEKVLGHVSRRTLHFE
jgi:hypothetical protein